MIWDGDGDWGDDEDWDLAALEEVEKQALAQRAQAPTASNGPASSAQQLPAVLAEPQRQALSEPQQQARQQCQEGPPRTPADLCRRCQLFRRAPLPPPRPTHDSCPGVYGRGCGGKLQLVQWAGGTGGPCFFWACTSYPDCAYREFPPPRKLTPELSITLDRWQRTLSVAAAPGAEDAVAWCGGVPSVLQAAGVDLRRALSVPPPVPQPAAALTAAAATSAGDASGATSAAAAQAVHPAVVKTAFTAADHAEKAPSNGGSAADVPPAAASIGAAVPGLAADGGQIAKDGSECTAAAPSSAAGELLAAAGGPAAAAQPAGAGQCADTEPGQLAAQPTAPAQSPAEAQSATPPSVVFPLQEYERLSTQLLQFGRQFGVCLLGAAGMVPPATLKVARGALRTLPLPDQVQQLYARMPRFLEAALMPFQREGVRYGLAHNGRCLIADEMGVGKTVQAIALSSCYQDEWPLLIIVPASLRLVWAEELEKWLPHLRPSSIHVIEGKEHRVAQGSVPLVCITSYEMMQRLTCDACKGRGGTHVSMCAGQRAPCRDPQNCMASLRWKVVVVDESHTLRTSNKPPDALHTEAVCSTLKLARRAILLTGTPSLSRPFDLFRQVDAVMPGLLGRSRVDFATAYCNRREVPLPGFHAPGERSTRMDVSGLSRGAELHDMLKAEVMLRRLKKDVLSQLPPKRRQVIRLPKPPASDFPRLAPGQRQHADDSEGSASSGDEGEGDGEGDEAEGDGADGTKGPAKPMSAAHRTGLAKASSVIDWLMTALGVRSGGCAKGGGGGTLQCGSAPGGRPQQAADEDDGGEGGAPGSADGPKFLVFAHHKTVMNRLAAALEGAAGYASVGYVRIDGGTDPEDRRSAMRRFRSDASIRVALLSVTAAGVGLDFSAASVVVFAELPDEVALVRQAEDRAHRQGQSQPVNIYFLCAKGTTDDRRWQHLNRSLARVSAVHDGTGLPGPAMAARAQAGGQAAGDAEEDGAAAAAAAAGEGGRLGPRAGSAVAATQAGLLVESVYDAEAAGLTPGAARAGLGAAAIQGGTQTGESPLPAAAATAVAGMLEEAAATRAAEATAEAEGRLAAGTAAATTAATAAEAADALPSAEAEAAAGDLGGIQPEVCPAGSTCVPPAAQPAPGGASAAAGAVAAAGSPPASSAKHRLPTRGSRRASLDSTAGAAPAAVADAGPGPAVPVAASGRGSGPSRMAQLMAQPAVPTESVQVWFEVSSNTNRVHLHAAPDGSAPMRLSLPMEALLAGDSPPLEQLLEAVSLDSSLPALEAAAAGQQQQQRQQQQQQQQQQQPLQQDGVPTAAAAPAASAGQAAVSAGQQQSGAPALAVAGGGEASGAAAAAGGEHTVRAPAPADERGQQQQQQQQATQEADQQRQRPAVVGGIGVLALDRHVSASRLAAMLAEAREFAAEWRELRGLHQSRLQGKVLRVPLQEAVDEVNQAAVAAGKLGTSTNRFVDGAQRSDLPVPFGAEWRMVRAVFKRYGKECDYQQPFLPDGSRLCINCAKPVVGKAAAQPAEAVLDGMTNLFCSGECEGRFALKSNGSAYRRALFKLERGVCVACRMDCHALVKRLQAVEKGSRDWEEQRRRIIAARAPRLMARGYKAYLDLLVRRAVEGNAWQADHILPVYKGGGLCDVDNLRTLCVACHADVTKEQVKERAATRQREKAGAALGGGGGGAGWQDVEYEGGGGNGQPLVKRRKKLQKLFCDDGDSDDAEGWPDTGVPSAGAGGAAAASAGAGAAARGAAAGGSDKPAQRGRVKPRSRLKPLFVESEEAEVGAAGAAAPAATAGTAGAEQPAAAAAAVAAAVAPSGGGKLSEQVRCRPRARLKPIFTESELEGADAGDAAPAATRARKPARKGAAADGAAAAAGVAAEGAAVAARTAAAAAAPPAPSARSSKPAQRARLKPRTKLKRLYVESESEDAEADAGQAAAAGAGPAEGQPACRHRLARNSSAGESLAAPLCSTAVNVSASVGGLQEGAAKKRPRAAAEAAQDAAPADQNVI